MLINHQGQSLLVWLVIIYPKQKKKNLGPENTKTQRIQNYKVLLLSVLNMPLFSK